MHEKYMATVMAAIVVAALYFGQPIFVPLALAILLSFALAPLVEFLRRIKFGRVPSVMVSVLFAFFVIGMLGSYIGTQLGQLAIELPHYQTNLVHKIHSVKGSADSSSVVQRGLAMFKALSDAGINVEMINTSEVRVNVVVDAKQGEAGLKILRDAFADVMG